MENKTKRGKKTENLTHGPLLFAFKVTEKVSYLIIPYQLPFVAPKKKKKKKKTSLKKQTKFCDATIGFPAKWRLRNERRNSILMTRHYSDLDSASDWSCRVGYLPQPIWSTTQIWVVTRHQDGISALVSQTSFCGETSHGVAKCRLSAYLCHS